MSGDERWWGGFGRPQPPIGVDARVRVMATLDSGLVVGGDFQWASGVAANGIACLDAEGWHSYASGLTIYAGHSGIVRALALYDGDLVAAGSFDNAGGAQARNVARWHGGQWLPMGTGTNQQSFALVAHAGLLYVGGVFSTAGGAPTHLIAAWNGESWSAVGGGIEGARVRTLAIHENDLYAAGEFTSAGGVPCRNVARWDGAQWQPLGPGLNGAVYDLLSTEEGLVAAGAFTYAGDEEPVNHIARWDGSAWQPIGAGTNGSVYTLAAHGGCLFAGGEFTEAGGSPAANVARWDGAQWGPVGAGTNDSVEELNAHGDLLLAGGSFTQAGGKPARFLAQWDGWSWKPTGRQSPPGQGLDDELWTFTTYQDDLIAGGWLRDAGGVPVRHLARWDGQHWATLGLGMCGGVRAVTVYDGSLVAAGATCDSPGYLEGIVRWDGSAWIPLGAPVVLGHISALAEYEGELYAGGMFYEDHLAPGNCIMRWNGAEWLPVGRGIDVHDPG
jgi:hypothetical protein